MLVVQRRWFWCSHFLNSFIVYSPTPMFQCCVLLFALTVVLRFRWATFLSNELSERERERERERVPRNQMPACCGWWSVELPLRCGDLGSYVIAYDISLTFNLAQTQFVRNIASILQVSVWLGPSTACCMIFS